MRGLLEVVKEVGRLDNSLNILMARIRLRFVTTFPSGKS